ncbi:photosystem I chlorophyll a/b-binding protein 5, chloroplastic-like isoform X2 [Phragmites australis]|nr:photosystem I chlorophyll a/b-binding protein 5, chloroplastic-like isoform X2 [Phragmites australis]
MAGVAGILVTDLLRVSGIRDLPVWFEAGATKFDFGNTTALFFVQLLLMGFAETKRYMDFINPGSQAEEGTFIGLEAALSGLQPGYPGGPLFNPLGLAKDIENAHEEKLKEIKNERLAINGSYAWLHCSSICDSRWPHRQSFDTPFRSTQPKYHSRTLLPLRTICPQNFAFQCPMLRQKKITMFLTELPFFGSPLC